MNREEQFSNKTFIFFIFFSCTVFLWATVAQDTAISSVSVGKCLQFDGTNDVVNAGDIDAFDSSQQLTAEMWVRIDKFDAWRTFFCKFQNLANRIQFQQYSEPGKIAVVVNNNADIKKEGNQAYYYTPNPEVTIGDWFHLAMVFDGTQTDDSLRLKLYINGMPRILKKEGTARGKVPAYLPSTKAPMLLGAEKSNGEYGYKGLMDEIRIWSVARSEQQIRDNMEHVLKGTEDGLRLYYIVDTQSETAGTLLDCTSEKHNGKLINFDQKHCFVNREVAIPVTAASSPKAEEQTHDGIRFVWVRGSGSANLVFATDRDTGIPHPESHTTYIANSEYGKGSRIGDTYWYCVYNGYDAQTSLSGLSPSTSYRFTIIDYNGAPGSEQYKSDSSLPIFSVTTAAAPARKTQEISFKLPEEIDMDKKFVILDAVSNSGLPVKIALKDSSIAGLIGDTLYMRAPGEVSITASQTGNETWAAAIDVTRIVRVKKIESILPQEPMKQPAAVKQNKVGPWLIAGGVAVVAGAIIGVILSNPDDNGGEKSSVTDRPPGDPVLGISH